MPPAFACPGLLGAYFMRNEVFPVKKTIGILGGMGPLATADLFQKIVRMTDAACDNDHIRIYIDNNAQIPDRTAAILSGGPDPVPAMLDSVNKLSSIGADVLIMPCNTAHYFLPRLRESSTVPFISMLEETALACKQAHGAAPVGLLGTSGTIRSGIYKKALEAQQVPCVEPTEEEQAVLMQLIYAVKAGESQLDRQAFLDVLAAMKARGATYFILGCTELPILADLFQLQESCIDPTTELARAAITYCGYQVKSC